MEFIEAEPPAKELVSRLGKRLSRDEWLSAYATPGVAVGGGTINLPTAKEDRLGAQLDLFCIFARGELEVSTFALQFLRSGATNFNVLTQEVVRQLFSPLMRDLRRYLEKHWGNTNVSLTYAADQIIPLNHDSDLYGQAIDRLKRVRAAVVESNQYMDEEDRAHRLAELTASQDLLDAPRVRAVVIETLTLRCLGYLGEMFPDGVIAQLVAAAAQAIGTLIGK